MPGWRTKHHRLFSRRTCGGGFGGCCFRARSRLYLCCFKIVQSPFVSRALHCCLSRLLIFQRLHVFVSLGFATTPQAPHALHPSLTCFRSLPRVFPRIFLDRHTYVSATLLVIGIVLWGNFRCPRHASDNRDWRPTSCGGCR